MKFAPFRFEGTKMVQLDIDEPILDFGGQPQGRNFALDEFLERLKDENGGAKQVSKV